MCIEKLIELLPNSVKCDTVDFKDVRLKDGRNAIRVTIDRLLTQEEKDKMTSKRFVGHFIFLFLGKKSVNSNTDGISTIL